MGKGRIIGVANEPTNDAAVGVWDLFDVYREVKANNWVGFNASGGIISASNGYVYHTFTSTANFAI